MNILGIKNAFFAINTLFIYSYDHIIHDTLAHLMEKIRITNIETFSYISQKNISIHYNRNKIVLKMRVSGGKFSTNDSSY